MHILDYITKEKVNSVTCSSKMKDFCTSKLRAHPLPKKQNETWRLANKKKLSALLAYEFDIKSSDPDIPPYLSNKKAINIWIGNTNQLNLKEKNWEIKELKSQEIDDLIEEKLKSSNTEENWSNLLNLSLSSEKNILGIKISGENIPPLQIFCSSKSNYFNSKTLILFIDKNTKANILQVNSGAKNSSLSLSTYIFLEEKSIVNHGVISSGNDKSNILNSLNIKQNANTDYNLGSIQFKYDFARFEIGVNQIEGNAKTKIKGMQVSNNDEQNGTFTKVEFNGPNGYLDQLNKSLANDKSHSIFDGSIIVPKTAQKTDASQLSRNLLLSNNAKIDTKPQLEIIADDVKCKHGATISELNKDELFYMRSRGLTFAEASKLQLKSYYQEIIDSIPVLEQRIEFLDHLLN